MDTKKLQVLLTALRTGSLTAAAEELGYTQAGLTQMMNSLEEELALKLLIRGKSGVRLSTAGKELLPKMEAMLRCEEELYQCALELSKSKNSVLRLGAYTSVTRRWLPGILTELRRSAPELEVIITTGGIRALYDAVKSDALDCAVVSYQQSLCRGLVWIQLHNDPLLAILPRNADAGEAFPIREFDECEFFMPADDFELDIMPVLAGEKSRITPVFRYTGMNDVAIVSMVAHGLGLSILSELVMQNIDDDVLALPLLPSGFRQLGIIVRESERNKKSIKRFIRCASAIVAQMYGENER